MYGAILHNGQLSVQRSRYVSSPAMIFGKDIHEAGGKSHLPFKIVITIFSVKP